MRKIIESKLTCGATSVCKFFFFFFQSFATAGLQLALAVYIHNVFSFSVIALAVLCTQTAKVIDVDSIHISRNAHICFKPCKCDNLISIYLCPEKVEEKKIENLCKIFGGTAKSIFSSAQDCAHFFSWLQYLI